MITVEEALNIILTHTYEPQLESVPFTECNGRILAEEVSADRDFPPFDRVTMDGIAISHRTFQEGQREFPIAGRQLAGDPGLTLSDRSGCLEVMTGALLPVGTDTVIRYEDLEISQGMATVKIEEVKYGQNVHPKGSDRQQGDLLLKTGTAITSAEVGVLATVGKSNVAVKQLPRIAIISTGDELVEVDKDPAAYQIRKSNVHQLKSALLDFQCAPTLFHIADSQAETVRRIEEISEQFDVLLLSGGVSKGKADHVPGALEELGYQKLFHRIKQRPGKPFWFGKRDDKVVFAFPGNPVSTFLCYQQYFIPWLKKSLGLSKHKQVYAVLAEDFSFKPALTYFLQVALYSDPQSGECLATPIAGHGSGDLANLLDCDGFLELPAERSDFNKGEAFRVLPFRPL